MSFDIRETNPAASVCLITYNHAPYIRECLDSILAQKTDFPFEVCLGEDGSTDGTREICSEYATRHPDRIRLFLRSRNEPGREHFISQGVYNYIETTRSCRGKYVALCDGDDAWTDPLKLQKQHDIMEADPSISLVHSDYDRLDALSGIRRNGYIAKKRIPHKAGTDKSGLILDLIQRTYPIAASTAFARTGDLLGVFERNLELFRRSPMGDVITWCELTGYGSFHFHPESLALYRLQPNSDSNTRSALKKMEFVNFVADYGLQAGRKYGLPMDVLRAAKVKNCNRYALVSGDRSEIERLYADAEYRFSFCERCIYLIGSSRLLHPVARRLFEWRFYIKHRLAGIL